MDPEYCWFGMVADRQLYKLSSDVSNVQDPMDAQDGNNLARRWMWCHDAPDIYTEASDAAGWVRTLQYAVSIAPVPSGTAL